MIGFGLQVRENGRKTFTLDYTFEGRRRRYFIGDHPTWSVNAARDEARHLKREIDTGRDPPTIADLVQRHLEEHVSKQAPDSARDITMRTHVLPLGARARWPTSGPAMWTSCSPRSRKAGATTQGRTQTEAREASPKPQADARPRKPGRLSYPQDVQLGHPRNDNPAAAFVRNPERPRERFLDRKEIERLSAALAEHPNQRFADIIRLLMLTGARRREVLDARWEQFDLEAAVWTKPATATKQRRLHRTPISGDAVALLRTIRTRVPGDCP